jgi:hypothetical protein
MGQGYPRRDCLHEASEQNGAGSPGLNRSGPPVKSGLHLSRVTHAEFSKTLEPNVQRDLEK